MEIYSITCKLHSLLFILRLKLLKYLLLKVFAKIKRFEFYKGVLYFFITVKVF